MYIAQHADTSVKMFGKPYIEVHHFLDQYYRVLGPYHRIILHHELGIHLINSRFKGPARDVAQQHIIEDLGEVPYDFRNFMFDQDVIYGDKWTTGVKINDILNKLYGRGL